MTRQEIFDTIVAHLHAQGQPAISGSSCFYRSPTGLKCAVGCLIPDDKYSQEIEHDAVTSAPVQDWAYRVGLTFIRDHKAFLSRMQDVHDIHAQGRVFLPAMQDVVREYGLSTELLMNLNWENYGND